MKMISLKPHVYGGKRFKTGDEFRVRNHSDARLMKALGRAYLAPAAPDLIEWPEPMKAVEPSFEAPEVAGQDDANEEHVEISPRTGKPKRQYRRKDMTAEDSE